ncbi:Haloacid dehalogenase domain protein hydrolase type 3 [Caldalkalibacillus thermarum TA2.A1]|uniref:Haloacid dehalogenase domain protein hydrolase type 3 n=1 Tax=Caldalkalibacillus thermarum (strain TA2.A1) TaxID=986075 RepID=F5L6N4_CALTT|nr:Haloacid dehalogenase domain protein hydrolase type 3 [Caldalkalibacillus thermarum TA2.A1]
MKLVAIDLDGTLLNPKGHKTPSAEPGVVPSLFNKVVRGSNGVFSRPYVPPSIKPGWALRSICSRFPLRYSM